MSLQLTVMWSENYKLTAASEGVNMINNSGDSLEPGLANWNTNSLT